MPITADQFESLYVLRLQGAVTIDEAAQLKNLLLDGLSSGKNLQLDLRQAALLDITTMQLLWAAHRDAEQSGQALVMLEPVPEQISIVVRQAGFDDSLLTVIPK